VWIARRLPTFSDPVKFIHSIFSCPPLTCPPPLSSCLPPFFPKARKLDMPGTNFHRISLLLLTLCAFTTTSLVLIDLPLLFLSLRLSLFTFACGLILGVVLLFFHSAVSQPPLPGTFDPLVPLRSSRAKDSTPTILRPAPIRLSGVSFWPGCVFPLLLRT